MDNKIEVEINGKIRRIMPHMLEDFERLGATRTRKIIRNAPPEILQKDLIQQKDIVLPPVKVEELKNKEKPPTGDVKTNVLPEMKTVAPIKIARKTPVRSKSKK